MSFLADTVVGVLDELEIEKATIVGHSMGGYVALQTLRLHPERMEGIVLLVDGKVAAVTMGSQLANDTFDIHFEKAREDVDGAYNAVNSEFARFLRLKYPQLAYLNREDDLGLEGLRQAKLSYNPHHMVEKYWACRKEDLYGESVT